MRPKNSVRICLAASLLALALISTVDARIITVDDDAPADFNNIQAAIDDAADGDVVEIKPGTYTGPGNYDIRFNGKPIIVRGTAPEDFDIVAATVIDCNQQGRGFIFESGEGPDSVLSGVTVTNAYYYEGSGYGGAAVGCVGSSPVITNCILTGNYGQGGGVGAREGSLIVRNCIITRNISPRYGGGIYTTLSESLTVENCIIAGNIAHKRGGAIRTRADTRTIKNCLIVGNRAGEYGGAIACTIGDLLVANCTITGNVAGEFGGALRGRLSHFSATVSNSILYGNYAPMGSEIALDDDWGDPNISLSWCNLQGGQNEIYLDVDSTLYWGPGNIDADPCFADPGYWGHITDPNIHVEPNDPSAIWIDGDYHLKSQAGRWDSVAKSWILDDVTSLCIDAGDPNLAVGLEPFPNGGRINLGIYRATAEASKSYFGGPPCDNIVAGDINGDCIVDGRDFALLSRNWLISSPLSPGRATDPDPPDEATQIYPDRWGTYSLSWQAGDGADTHDVYFGTVSPGAFCGNQTGTTFEIGFAVSSGTYYWRVDEISATGKTTGTVWSFTIPPPAPATNPNPPDGAVNFYPDAQGDYRLSWEPGHDVSSHDVYFGMESPGEFQGNLSGSRMTPPPNTFNLGPALAHGAYYWRIDEINYRGKTTGTVWSFRISPPDPASDPYPADQSDYSSTMVSLSWQAGPGAESHDVYFGTESPGEFQGNQAEAAFNPGSLEAQRTYYWRIDEINGYGTTTGPVWQFTCKPGR